MDNSQMETSSREVETASRTFEERVLELIEIVEGGKLRDMRYENLIALRERAVHLSERRSSQKETPLDRRTSDQFGAAIYYINQEITSRRTNKEASDSIRDKVATVTALSN